MEESASSRCVYLNSMEIMTFTDFENLINKSPSPVVLLEGKRNIPAAYYRKAVLVAEMLARRFPALRFRSGNAEGSDQAFADGVKSVDPQRLQIIAPYKGHRRFAHIPGATYDSPESLSAGEEEKLIQQTLAASPQYRPMMETRKKVEKLTWKSVYLIRDTMKVTGHTDKFPVPVAALFYVDPADSNSGGTGHTIRVCRENRIPVVFQDEWEKWL